MFTLYNVINMAAIRLLGLPGDQVVLGVEPILFGVFCLGIDLLLIKMKHMVSGMIQDATKKPV